MNTARTIEIHSKSRRGLRRNENSNSVLGFMATLARRITVRTSQDLERKKVSRSTRAFHPEYDAVKQKDHVGDFLYDPLVDTM